MSGIIESLCEGHALENSALWQNRAVAAQALASILGAGVAIAGVCGWRIDLDSDAVATIAGGFVTALSVSSAVIGLVTSKHVGLKGKKP